MTQLNSDQLFQLVKENQALLSAMAVNQIGHTDSEPEWKEKAMAMLGDHQKVNPTAQNLHGPGGTWSTPGLDRMVISTHIEPYGLATRLPLLPSADTDPRFASLTGFSDDIGDEPDQRCDPGPTGYTKGCILTAQYGYMAKSTERIDQREVRMRVNRGDLTDLQMMGLNFQQGMANGMMPQVNTSQILNMIETDQMVNTGVRMHRDTSTQLWQGTPANNNAGGGHMEGPGLDAQIVTGQVDAAKENTLCPSLDSDVKDFNYNDVQGTGLDIVRYLSMLDYYLTSLDRDTGAGPVSRVICMREQLWHNLSQVWPQIYNTDRTALLALAAATNVSVNINGTEMVRERDAMRLANTITINGRIYPVVTDTGIYEQNNANDANLEAGQYASSIYFVPLTINGRVPVTYRNYVDYRQAFSGMATPKARTDFWTDRGVFSWAITNERWCRTLHVSTEQRVVLRTPQLAGRLDNVRYTPLQHLREADPSSPYWVDGGVSLRGTDSKYAVWL